jgi:hypothetical protein
VAVAEERLGKGPRFLVGFSNGGYFASLIAVRALIPVDAIAIAHAGAGGAVKANGAKPPIVLLTADEDSAIESMMAFDAELTREGWPHAIASRDGGHEITDGDFATALAFFQRAPHERFPLSPPISTRPPRPKPARADRSDVDVEPLEVDAGPTAAPGTAPAPAIPEEDPPP